MGDSFALDGNIAVGHIDIFTSVSDNAELSFSLIDNLVVVPEPVTAWVVGLGLLALVTRRN